MRRYKTREPRRNLPELKITYQGFNRDFKDAPYIALIAVSGDTDVWALDNPDEAVEQLKLYYQFDEEEITILGVYKNEGHS